MSKFKILVKVTGSIAAYKVAYLVSRLVQNNCEVKVAATQSALKFVGAATFEGLTGNPVFTDTFEPGKMMSHINLVKWADLTIVVPADANTINKFTAGIADNLITSLFLAHDWKKPYLIAPAMNVAMLKHPATRRSLKILEEWGIKILPTGSGHLACGDEGEGKLLEPEIIFGYIFNELRKKEVKNKRVLITGGATKEQIDKVRFVSNLSTGRTSAELADALYLQGFNVTLLKAQGAVNPKFDVRIFEFHDFKNLRNKLKDLISSENFNAVIHLAAVSDFSPDFIELEETKLNLPLKNKLDSNVKQFKITFGKNEKIVNRLKEWSKERKVQIVSFKFLDKTNSERKEEEIKKLLAMSEAVVFNSIEGRENGIQKLFEFYRANGEARKNLKLNDLIKEISKLLMEVK